MAGFETLLDRIVDDMPRNDAADINIADEYSILIAALLQPAKGAIIALQWWMGLHGFEKPVRPAAAKLPDIVQDPR